MALVVYLSQGNRDALTTARHAVEALSLFHAERTYDDTDFQNQATMARILQSYLALHFPRYVAVGEVDALGNNVAANGSTTHSQSMGRGFKASMTTAANSATENGVTSTMAGASLLPLVGNLFVSIVMLQVEVFGCNVLVVVRSNYNDVNIGSDSKLLSLVALWLKRSTGGDGPIGRKEPRP